MRKCVHVFKRFSLIHLKCRGTGRLRVAFVCINMFFVCTDRTDPKQQPLLSSLDTKEVAALSLAHTLLSSSQSFAPMGTKAQCGETERGDDNPQLGESKVLGVLERLMEGISVGAHVLLVCKLAYMQVCD